MFLSQDRQIFGANGLLTALKPHPSRSTSPSTACRPTLSNVTVLRRNTGRTQVRMDRMSELSLHGQRHEGQELNGQQAGQ